MKVEIKYSEEKGFWGKIKAYNVWMGVTFSEEEKAIISNKNLGKTLFTDWVSNDERRTTIPADINRLVKNGCFAEGFPNPIEAQEFAEHLKEKMRVLKSFIDGSGREQKNESFEL